MYFEDFVNNQEKVKIKEKDFERKIEIKEEEKNLFRPRCGTQTLRR